MPLQKKIPPSTAKEKALRRRYKLLLDYSSGYSVMKATRKIRYTDPTTGNEKEGEVEQIAILPLRNFYQVFCNPNGFADGLESMGEELVEEWNRCNAGKKASSRSSKDRAMTLMKHTWKGEGWTGFQTSEYDLQLQTYGITDETYHEEQVNISKNDVQVWIKLRTTKGVDTVADRSRIVQGMVYDQFGSVQRIKKSEFLI